MSEQPTTEDLMMARRRCLNLSLAQDSEEVVVGELDKLQSLLAEWEPLQPRIKKAEPEYTKNIEGLLDGLKAAVDVVRKVSPEEARANLGVWKEPIAEEFEVVEKGFEGTTWAEIKKKFDIDDILQVPAKIVYTIKPPKPGSHKLYRRKARIVACGNMIDEQLAECFASSAAGETLRCLLVEVGRRSWLVGAVDVTGAFMLTPMPTEPGEKTVVVSPPGVLILLGIVPKNGDLPGPVAVSGQSVEDPLHHRERLHHLSSSRGYRAEPVDCAHGRKRRYPRCSPGLCR